MNLDDFKKKAEEITKNLQDNVVPEIKEKTKKAKDNVVSFVEEKVSKKPEESAEEEKKPDIIERYVDGEPVGCNSDISEETKAEESEADVKEAEVKESEESEADVKEAEVKESEADAAEDNTAEVNESEDTIDNQVSFNEIEDDVDKEISDFINEKDEPETVKGDIISNSANLKEGFMTTVLPKVKSVTGTAGTKLKEVAGVAAPKVKDVASAAGNKIKEVASAAAPKVKDVASAAGTKIKETAQNVAPKVKNGAKDAVDKISFESYRAKEKAKNKTKDAITHKIRKNLFPNEYDEHGNLINEKNDIDESEKSSDEKKNPFKAIGSNISNSLNDNKAYSHAKTILSHKKLVMEHCTKAGIPLQGLTHDLSKFSPAEFLYGVKFFSGDRSPNEGEREDHGYSNAWMHHKGRNKHHFEYWIDYNIEANKAIPVKMPLKYVIEMFCDRVAAGKVYKKEAYTDSCPLEYFEKGRARRNIHPETSDFLEKLLRMLAKKGEDYTFSYIRWYMKHHDDY